MKAIPLTKGLAAVVDDNDYDHLNQWSWYADVRPCGTTAYAVRKPNSDLVYMHKIICPCPDGLDVDHINGDRLDNRRNNLRVCTRSQNLVNKKLILKGTSSEYRGVCLYKRTGKWVSYINVDSHRIHLGYVETEIEAALAYDRAATRLHGVFAQLNFPENGIGK